MRDPRKIRFYSQYPRARKSLNLSITTLLILINVVFFVFVILTSLFFKDFLNYVALKPDDFMQGKYLWSLLTSMFMHGGFFHLFINMFVLFSLGSLCEKIIGRKRFFIFYLISGLVAGLVFVFFAYFFGSAVAGSLAERIFSSPVAYAVGASGAIFAIAGLFMILTPRLRFMIIFLPFFSLPAYIMIPLVLFVTWIVSSGVGIGIGNTAHLGGFLVGVFYGIYLKRKYKRKARLIARYFSG